MSHVKLNICWHSVLQYLLLKDTCRLLHEDNDSLSHRCAKLEQQMVMLEQQAAESNRQVCLLTLDGHIKTTEQRTIIQQYGDWYTGR